MYVHAAAVRLDEPTHDVKPEPKPLDRPAARAPSLATACGRACATLPVRSAKNSRVRRHESCAASAWYAGRVSLKNPWRVPGYTNEISSRPAALNASPTAGALGVIAGSSSA